MPKSKGNTKSNGAQQDSEPWGRLQERPVQVGFVTGTRVAYLREKKVPVVLTRVGAGRPCLAVKRAA